MTEVNRYGFNSLPNIEEISDAVSTDPLIDATEKRQWFLNFVENTKEKNYSLAEYKAIIEFLENI